MKLIDNFRCFTNNPYENYKKYNEMKKEKETSMTKKDILVGMIKDFAISRGYNLDFMDYTGSESIMFHFFKDDRDIPVFVRFSGIWNAYDNFVEVARVIKNAETEKKCLDKINQETLEYIKKIDSTTKIKGFRIDKVIFNNPATIVFWKDGTKTVVKSQNEDFDPEKGLAMAISKKAFGNEGRYYEEFKKWVKYDKPAADFHIDMTLMAAFEPLIKKVFKEEV